MDDVVLRAMTRWPDVPAVYGWLALTGRGQWRLRGEPISHPGLVAFINRNYQGDERGAWYFQNGPQRVFVTLATAPLILRLAAGGATAFESHTGYPVATPSGAGIDGHGTLFLTTNLGPGALDDRDLERLCEWLVAADGRSLAAGAPLADPTLALHLDGLTLPLRRLADDEVESRLGFVRDPARLHRQDGGGAGAEGD